MAAIFNAKVTRGELAVVKAKLKATDETLAESTKEMANCEKMLKQAMEQLQHFNQVIEAYSKLKASLKVTEKYLQASRKELSNLKNKLQNVLFVEATFKQTYSYSSFAKHFMDIGFRFALVELKKSRPRVDLTDLER